MAYLGNAPARSFISFERQVFTIVNSQTAYTLNNSVTNENDIRLVINNIVQEPGSGKAYTASGTTLTLSAALVNGTDEMYCVFLGRATATNAPSAGSVGTSQLAADAVTEAKIADDAVESEHLNDNVISGQTELAAEPADTDEFLVSDAGTLKRIDYSLIKAVGGLSEVDIWRYTSSSSSAANYLTSNLERDDTTGATYIGTGMSESSGVFTFPSTGKYLIKANGTFYNDTGPDYYASMQIHVTTNDSSYSAVSYSQTNSMNSTGTTAYMNSNALFLFDVTDTSTHKVKFYWNRSGHAKIIGSTSVNQTYFLFQKLGDT